MQSGAGCLFINIVRLDRFMSANQTLQRTPGSLAVLAGAGGGAAELVVIAPGKARRILQGESPCREENQ